MVSWVVPVQADQERKCRVQSHWLLWKSDFHGCLHFIRHLPVFIYLFINFFQSLHHVCFLLLTLLGLDPRSPCSPVILEAVYFTARLSSALTNTQNQREKEEQADGGVCRTFAPQVYTIEIN